jgi:hypothetical protein
MNELDPKTGLTPPGAVAPSQPPLGAKQWEDIRALVPAEVCRRTLVSWDESGYFTVPFLNGHFRVFPATGVVDSPSADSLAANPEFRLVLLCYLTMAKELPFSGSWVSEKDLKGGSMFFRGPHGLPAEPLIKHFGTSPAKFVEAGLRIGGEVLPGYGDAAVAFTVLPRIRAACVLWAGDDEFPARASFLFDATTEAHLPLDVLGAMVRYLVKRIGDGLN